MDRGRGRERDGGRTLCSSQDLSEHWRTSLGDYAVSSNDPNHAEETVW